MPLKVFYSISSKQTAEDTGGKRSRRICTAMTCIHDLCFTGRGAPLMNALHSYALLRTVHFVNRKQSPYRRLVSIVS